MMAVGRFVHMLPHTDLSTIRTNKFYLMLDPDLI
jgi:hypothetical protein